MATETDIRLVEFVSALVRWVDDTYESLIYGGTVKEYVCWITTRVIRSIFEDYLDPYRANPTRTYFGSDPHLRITLVWGVIFSHLVEDKMLSKNIKYHTIVVGDYDKWLVSNSDRNEAIEDKKVTVKLKDTVDELSA